MTQKTTDEKIDNLAQMMLEGFKSAEENTDKKIEGLAQMVAKGFSNIEERMATKDNLQEVKRDIKEINMKLHDIDENTRRHSTRIERLEENAGIL